MTRPKIIIPLTINDKIVESFALLGIVAIWGVSIYHYSDLPDIIPRHFNSIGEPDAYGNRNFIWTLPTITTVLYIGLTWIGNVPHTFNYPIKITPENAAYQYRKAVQMMRILKMVITLGLAYMTYKTVQVALGNNQSMGNFTLLIFVLVIFAVIAWYMLSTKKSEE